MFAAATSFFSRTAISQSYNMGHVSSSGSRSSTPGPHVSPSPGSPAALSSPIQIGLWKVQPASHKVTSKRVSVWLFDKRGSEMERLSPNARDRTLEILKNEASALGRLRHPSILEMVEPLEETRAELMFATEPVLSSLQQSVPGGQRYNAIVELDEVEIQKGILQICKGLSFLHSSARLIHSNISPEIVVINSSGDWKISGLGLTIPLIGPDGKPTRWEFPTFDGRVPNYIQRSFDYMAPEYALDEKLVTGSDMYSLGCLIYAVHNKASPPFKSYDSLGGLRDNVRKPIPNLDRLESALQDLLRSLITRLPEGRPTPSTLPTHPFFSSLPISTLNFLDRSNFTTKSREEKISFMKGLTSVLGRFSESLRTRKILPSLLEEMKDTNLLPYILPNVFAISTVLTPIQFAVLVLPSLKPLFAVKEPPQNMMTLLDNLPLLQEKTEKAVFREQVLALVYNALESEHAVVQERALKTVPDLCESIDYAEVQGVLFPRVALVFTKTRILSVKIATLVTFLSMVKTLDQTSLTQKLVPLLSKIRTKEPGVMMATLSVQEAMGFKVDREAVATLVLPQLWAMSMGPLLNVEQFQRFMGVIRKLGERVEKEHNQFLRDSQRIEDRSTSTPDLQGAAVLNDSLHFESLVNGSNGAALKSDTVTENKSWDDDVWGSIFTGSAEPPRLQGAVTMKPNAPSQSMSQTIPSPVGLTSAGRSMLSPPPQNIAFIPASNVLPLPQRSRSSATLPLPSSVMQPDHTGTSPSHFTGSTAQNSFSKPNYNIALASLSPNSQLTPLASNAPSYGMNDSNPIPSISSLPLFASPTMNSILSPSKITQSWTNNGTTAEPSIDVWGDFDPLA